MAQLSTKLDVRFSWWVRPYLGLVCLMCFAIAPFLEADDETIDHLLKMHSNFICRHGVHCSLS